MSLFALLSSLWELVERLPRVLRDELLLARLNEAVGCDVTVDINDVSLESVDWCRLALACKSTLLGGSEFVSSKLMERLLAEDENMPKKPVFGDTEGIFSAERRRSTEGGTRRLLTDGDSYVSAAYGDELVCSCVDLSDDR